jgi:hypothetical protein
VSHDLPVLRPTSLCVSAIRGAWRLAREGQVGRLHAVLYIRPEWKMIFVKMAFFWPIHTYARSRTETMPGEFGRIDAIRVVVTDDESLTNYVAPDGSQL